MYSIYKSATVKACILVICLVILINVKVLQAEDNSAAVCVINISGDGGNVTVITKNVNGDQPTDDGIIRWSNVNAGEKNWWVADQYLEITYQDLPELWGIMIYTDNKNGTPEYTGASNPAGLVNVDNTSIAIPLAWRITDKLIPLDDPEDPDDNSDIIDPPIEELHDSGNIGFDDYCWRFIRDKNTPDDPNTSKDETFPGPDDGYECYDYVTIWNQAGIGWNEGGRSGASQVLEGSSAVKKAYLYLVAKFTAVAANTEYKTTTLTLEAYHGISPFPIYIYDEKPITRYFNDPDADEHATFNHFGPAYMNYKKTGSSENIVVDDKCIDDPHSGRYCFKFTWNGAEGADGGKQAAIMWLEPPDLWEKKDGEYIWPEELREGGPGVGYDLRGASWLRFWARADAASLSEGEDLRFEVFLGQDNDSDKSPRAWRSPLTTGWQEYGIRIYRDMSHISGGFFISVDDEHTPKNTGCTIYFDDIRYE